MTHQRTRSSGSQGVSAAEPRLGPVRALAVGVAPAIAFAIALSTPQGFGSIPAVAAVKKGKG